MGGSAFPDLKVPRISPAEYAPLCDHFSKAIHTLYKEVIVPPECPGKIDHGDIDILAVDPRDEAGVTIQDIASALGAHKYTGRTSGGATASFAVPSLSYQLDGASSPSNKGLTFVQVDVHTCQPGTFQWENFTKSYGDLWNIVGSQIRGAGLTANNMGFYVRNAEIERLNRNRAMIFLSRDPAKVLDFLGLDHEAFKRGWETPKDMFAWATQCRFFDLDVFRDKGEYLKANDRKRLKLRAVYREFVFNYVSSLNTSSTPVSVPTREETLEQALDVFDARSTHDTTLREWRLEQKHQQAWHAVREALPQTDTKSGRTKKGQLMTLLKNRISLEPGKEPDVIEANFAPSTFVAEDGEIQVEELVNWVLENREDLRSRVKGEQSGEEPTSLD